MATIHITKDNFEKEVINSSETVLVDFWATWCGPCQMLLPIVEELSEETNAKICKINVDEEPQLAERYGISTIPTLLVIKNGNVLSTSVGVKSKEAIKEMLNV